MIFNLAATFISAALLVPNVFGQAPTNTSGVPPCVLNCTTTSLSAGGCTSVTQLSCICTSVPFQTAAGACILSNCPTEEAAAIQIQNATCGPYLAGLNSTSSSSSGSTSGSHSSTGTAAPAGTTGTAGTTHPSTTATTSSSGGFHTAGIASGVALALFGAAFSLF